MPPQIRDRVCGAALAALIATGFSSCPDAQTASPAQLFQQGVADRGAWEMWFSSLSGDYKTGAFFWAGQRSLPHPGSCQQMDKDFFDGCIAAKRRLATPDLMRKSEPAYKMGWNSWAPNTTPAAHVEAPAVPPANSASTPDGAPAADANLSFDQAIDFCKAAVNRYINGSFDAYTNPGTGTVHMLYTFPAETFYFDKCMNLAGHPMDSYNGAQ